MTGPYHQGDIVAVDHMGREFLAMVDGEKGQDLKVKPLTCNVTYYTVGKREVKALYRKAKGTTPFPKPMGGITYDSRSAA